MRREPFFLFLVIYFINALTVYYRQLERIKQHIQCNMLSAICSVQYIMKTMLKRIRYYVISQRQSLPRLHSLKSKGCWHLRHDKLNEYSHH